MTAITNEMVRCAYETGNKVWNGTLTPKQGTEEICRECGMNKTSASNMLHVIQCMLNGETYRRTINAYATEYFLAKIGEDFGTDTQQKAARAALQHVEHYMGLENGGYQRKVKEIAARVLREAK